MAWERVCAPKSVGEINAINMPMWDKAAIAKFCWDVAAKKDTIWIK